MRVLVVNQYAVDASQPGGTRHYSLCRELIRRGHDVKLMASSFNHGTGRDDRLGRSEVWRNETCGEVPFVWLRSPAYRGNGFARLWNMLSFAKRVWSGTGLAREWQPDVVIGSNPQLFAAWASNRIARKLHAKFVLEIRDLWPQTFVDMGAFGRYHPFVLWLAWIERVLYRRAERVISLLPLAADHVEARGGDRSKVVWIPNGIDIEMLPPVTAPPDDGVFTIMYAGSHARSDGLEVLLDAAGRLLRGPHAASIRFVLLGDGSEKSVLLERAHRENLCNVSFLDPVPKSSLFTTMAVADAFVVLLKDLPLYRYGASFNKFYDYLAVGRPTVVAASIPNNPFVESGAGLCVAPGDAAGIAGACVELLQMTPQQRNAMGAAGRAYVETYHSCEHLGEQLESVLVEVVDECQDIAN